MAYDFPDAPALNDEVTVNGRTYTWDGTKWVVSSGNDLTLDDVTTNGDTTANDITVGSITAGNLGTASTEDVTTSPTDTTAGRLLKVGDFGVGTVTPSTIVDSPYTNADDVNVACLIRFNSTQAAADSTLPSNSPGVLEVMPFGSTFTVQRYSHVFVSDKVFTRANFNGVWQPWREIYHQGSILGTVSESAGVPTGAVIERGSNANGEYVKFADGTMICTRNESLLTSDNYSVGSYDPGDATFPATFAAAPQVSAGLTIQTTDVDTRGDFTISTASSTTASWRRMTLTRITSNGSAAVVVSLELIAIGRWF